MNGKKLHEAMQKYEIKTTANQILDAYASQQEEKIAKKSKTSWWKWSAVFTTACSLAVIAYFIFLPKTNVHEIQDDPNNRVAFQLLSGMELSHFFTNSDQTQQRKNKRAATEEEFIRIVDVYDKANDMVQSAYLSKQNLQKKVYEGNFAGKYKDSYPYKMELTGTENLTFYYDGKIEKDRDEVEMTIRGEIHQNNEIYRVIAETENSAQENEYEISIFFDEYHYVVIEQEEEQNEYEYLYTLYENKKKTYEIEFENEEGEQSLKIKENTLSYDFKIEHKNSSEDWIQYHTTEAEGMMTLQSEGNKRIYTENETQQKIEKNFQ